MRRVLLATTPHHPRALDDAPALLAALAHGGAEALTCAWDDSLVQWAGARVHLLSPWDYQHRLPEFVAWLRRIESEASPLHSEALVTWNLHKGYLLELQSRGVRGLPTRILAGADDEALHDAARALGASEVVVKAAVGAGADGLFRWRITDPVPTERFAGLARRGDVVVQAYSPRIETEGELGVVWIDGRVHHVVEKRPKPGDFRVQPSFGGSNTVRAPNPGEVRLAEGIVAASPFPLRYARVDLIPSLDDDGWCLGELEVIEPELFLRLAPETATALAAALLRDSD